jgi:hypothetical protein
MESHNPNRQICWPEFSPGIPIEFADRLPKIRKDVWPRMQAGLYLVATTGWSVVQELMLPLAERFGLSPRVDSLHRVYRIHLPKSGLVIYKTLPLFRKHGLAVVRLTELGKSICAQLGWKVVISDWEKLINDHEGERLPKHTAMVLAFAYQARLRGYRVEVLPVVERKYIAPDLSIETLNTHVYVEVENGKAKIEKWINLEKLQGFVAICTDTEEKRRHISEYTNKPLDLHGLATDLETLVKCPSYTPITCLWMDSW